MDGVRVDLSSGEEVTYTGQNGQKKLVRVRERVRITFSFISTGTDIRTRTSGYGKSPLCEF